MNEYPPIVVIIAAILAVLTTVISIRALRDNPVLGNPAISILVGLISFIGLCSFAGKALPLIILPYIALALSLPIVLFLLLFSKSSKESHSDTPDRHSYDSSKRENSELCERHRRASSMNQENLPHENDEKDRR